MPVCFSMPALTVLVEAWRAKYHCLGISCGGSSGVGGSVSLHRSFFFPATMNWLYSGFILLRRLYMTRLNTADRIWHIARKRAANKRASGKRAKIQNSTQTAICG